MINGQEMVTDRSLADVDFAKKQVRKGVDEMRKDGTLQEFTNGLKGAYNYTDFNRVEKAVHYLDRTLPAIAVDGIALRELLGVAPDVFFNVPYDPKDYGSAQVWFDWDVFSTINQENRERYINNVRHIVAAFGDVPPWFPSTLVGLDYIGANNIEKALEETNEKMLSLRDRMFGYLENTALAWYYSNDFYGGEL